MAVRKLSSVVLATAISLAVTAAGCSLSNVSHDDCQSTSQCAALFGLGSTCSSGFCTDPPACTTGHDCRERFGGGACVKGLCTATLPVDPACFLTEPEDLLKKSAVGSGSYTILGGVMSIYEDYDLTLSTAARLAVREINRTGGGIDGRPFGIVFCDNAGKSESGATGDARTALNQHAMDYLSGTLGVPAIVGPSSSSDAIALVNRALEKRYPTVIVSPSATSPALSNQPDRLDKSDPYGLFWRTCPSDQLQGQVMAEKVMADTTINSVAVVYVQDAYGEGLSQIFAKIYGLDHTTLIPYEAGADLGAIGPQVASAGVDGVLIVAVVATDTVAILQKLADQGLDTKKYFFTDGAKDKATLLDPKLSQAVKNMILGAIGTAPARPSGANYDLFKANLLKDFKVEADSYSFLAQTYDAGYCAAYGVLYAAEKDPKYDGRLVAEGLAHLSKGSTINVGPVDWPSAKTNLTSGQAQINLVGASGDLDFDAATGEAPAPIEVWAVNPNFTDFTTVEVDNP